MIRGKENMKKIMLILVVGFLVFSGLGAVTVARTCQKINHAPDAPLITGPHFVRPGTHEWIFKATDFDGDDVYYYIDWGEGKFDDWFGPFESCEEVTRNHTFVDYGDVTIMAQAKDIHGAIGEVGTLEVTISKSSQQSTTGSSSQNIISIAPSSRTLINNGTLSGYVNDTSENPIEGALVRVHFHGTYEEDYSDSKGYYHVTNIPICYCLKNTTCSKERYKTEWVLLSIVEDTTYDFILTPINNPPETPEIDGPISPKIGVEYDYIFYTTDPDGDDVSYYIEWGDGAVTDWIGPYASGEEVCVSHTWTKKGIYLLRCKAKDHPYEAESDWLEVLIRVPPRIRATVSQISQQLSNTVFFQMLQRLPNNR